MTWEDRTGGVVIVGVAEDNVVAEVLYLWQFLWGGLICDDVAEVVMVGECWRSNVMYLYMLCAGKKCHATGLYCTKTRMVLTYYLLFLPMFVSVVKKVISVVMKGRQKVFMCRHLGRQKVASVFTPKLIRFNFIGNTLIS